MNIIIITIIITNLYRNVQVFVLNKSMLFYVMCSGYRPLAPTVSFFSLPVPQLFREGSFGGKLLFDLYYSSFP